MRWVRQRARLKLRFSGAVPDGAWTVGTNWTGSVIPNSTDVATFTAGGTYTVTLGSSESIYGLVLNSANATLQVNSSNISLTPTILGSSGVTAGTLVLNNSEIIGPSSLGFYAFNNAGTITASGSSTSYIYSSGTGLNGLAFVNTGTVNVTSGALTLGLGSGDSVTNSLGATMTANGATLNFDGGNSSIVNLGTLQAINGGTINIGGTVSTAGLEGGVIDAAGLGNSVNITGTVNNIAQTLNPPTTGIFTLVSGGQITGGTVVTGALTFGNGGTLSGVTMTGNFSAPSGATFYTNSQTLFQTGTTTFANNIVRVGTGSPGLTIAPDEAFTGNLSIYATAANAAVVNNGSITITSGGNTIYGAGNSNFVFTNNGMISSTGGSLTLGTGQNDAVTNNSGGLIEATNGTSVSVGMGSDTITNNGTLEATGAGSILVLGSGTICGTRGVRTTMGSALSKCAVYNIGEY